MTPYPIESPFRDFICSLETQAALFGAFSTIFDNVSSSFNGFFGSVFAREAYNLGKKVLVIDKRNHIGGNCYSKIYNGINVHEYGPHIFNTNNE